MSSQNQPVVLIAEDEALVRMLLVEVFEEDGFEVLEASNGERAVQLMGDRDDIGGLLTDVQMPGKVDGYELARIAKRDCPGCTILIASGRQWPKPGDLPDGAEFVRKPFTPDEMVRRFAVLRVTP